MSGKYAQRNAQDHHVIAKDDPLAISLLKEEHHIFRSLFDEAENADAKRLAAIARELCMRLSVHMTIEEEILYPALKPVLGDDEINEGIVEHQSGKRIVAELEQLDGTEDLFAAKVHVLGEETVHHIDEEDEDMFEDAKAAHASGKIDLDALGERLRARQAQLYDDIARTGETGKTSEAQPDEVERADRAVTGG
ncbi:hemerythrin domain-containing protein [Sphingomonadaceae bacterium G21617-S1]|jgi:hemerythrin-like domain-containing protein|uniref:hemerythrin domain-containing protein n=1 Tax=Rhizorhabdus sp. TaxID=1968843 RepID=UPI001212CF3C|nr:hemerythrin domain-containing protein [Rhizorhabdus sp.]MBD3759723.1 hemerythrin domain-containing protein [Rhizorhabdus sp.]MCZ4343083.1 hemerythrin domain-containing protein [Sphingomonadaceae bacterium G21617-S1]TAK16282.1 MAG: hemerythrin domain-containing protein [Rhizorhabdus sp.]